MPGLAIVAQGMGLVPRREAFALVVADEGVMVVARNREVEKGLEEAVNVGGIKEVLSPGDVADSLEGIVDCDGEVIRGGNVLSGENNVSEDPGIDGD